MLSNKHEELLKTFKNYKELENYKKKYDYYQTGIFPKIIAKTLFGTVDLIYGKNPTIQKFKVIEVVARVPYQTWEFVNYLWTTNFYTNENKAIKYAKRSDFGKFAQDNETMHVVVISQICKSEKLGNFLGHTLLPIILAYIYFLISTILYMFSSKSSYELNYLFENHAYNQYDLLIKKDKNKLEKKKIHSKFLKFYGRECKNQLEFFESVKNDEIIHRNTSIEEMNIHF